MISNICHESDVIPCDDYHNCTDSQYRMTKNEIGGIVKEKRKEADLQTECKMKDDNNNKEQDVLYPKDHKKDRFGAVIQLRITASSNSTRTIIHYIIGVSVVLTGQQF